MKNKRFSQINKIILLYSLLIPIQVFSLDDFNVEYTIKKGLITVGKITRNFKIVNDKFKFESTFETTGVTSFLKRRLYELSEGQIIEQKLHPSSYLRETTEEHKNFSLKFRDKAKTVERIDKENGYVLKKTESIQDKLSYQAQLMLEFKLLKIPSDQHDPFFFIASQKEIEIYDIKNLGYKTIKTPLGKFKTIVLHRKVKDSKKEDTVYLASELNWLPVRIDHLDKKGRKMVAVIEKNTTF